ncbi:hypothetical protein [Colwellia psychrerythraea]|uniref:Lipoprotein n=1 Tax=Colwellia psychrerythraea TaxID=28229 RepID=A0A099KHI6_COLPS|nr:hypothetical protein [Colwellia psychrerythraea]KGJ89710.1 hypothetical protein GAB14E_3871 [Colwellia psychrerythraea]
MRSTCSLIIILLTLSACSSDSVETSDPTPSQVDLIDQPDIIEKIHSNNLAIPDNRFSNNYEVLIFGNSHTSKLSSLIETLISTGKPYAKIKIINAGGGFLDNITQKRTDLLENNPWTHVILQGQKYSQSGSIIYPTTAAQMWIDKAKRYKITPILFPEHPQEGNTTEGGRVHRIHTSIANIQRSCVAPVGLAWDKVITIEPQLVLHSSDGNHAAFLGKLLTAFVFYEVITGEAADLLPFIKEIEVEESTQQLLKQLASETIQSNQPCLFGN